MSNSTVFTFKSTTIASPWLNDVNTVSYGAYVYNGLWGTFQAAVTQAFNTGNILYLANSVVMPTGVVVSYLHDVQKVGKNGSIGRRDGSNILRTFYPWPSSGQTNTLYVNTTTGLDTNDGITSDLPIRTTAKAFAILLAYSDAILAGGNWVIQFAAATDQTNVLLTFPENLRGISRIVLQGPTVVHPNVPTYIVDGQNAAAYGWNFNGNNKVQIKYIDFVNFTSYGVVAQDYCDISTTNVHTSGCGIGLKFQQCRVRIDGGIHGAVNRNGIDTEFISCVTYTVGDLSGSNSTANGTQFLGATTAGLFAQECGLGHANYCTFDGGAVNIDLTVKSRCDGIGNLIKNGVTAGVRQQVGSDFVDNAGSNTFTGNSHDVLSYSFSVRTNEQSRWTSELEQPIDRTTYTTTGTTTPQTLQTYANAILHNSFNSSINCYKACYYGTITGVAGTKRFDALLNGTSVGFITVVAGTLGDFELEVEVFAVSSASQIVFMKLLVSGFVVATKRATSAIVVNGGAMISSGLTTTLGNAGDTIAISLTRQMNRGGC